MTLSSRRICSKLNQIIVAGMRHAVEGFSVTGNNPMVDTDLPWMATGGAGLKTSIIPSEPMHFKGSEVPEEFLSFPRNAGALALGHFDVLETIGRGGFGVVVKAFDQKLQRIVAIKMMSAELATTSPARRRFVREARAGAAVRHENVVRIYAVEEQPIPHLVMEYVPGVSLQHHLDCTGPLEVREVLRIGAQIARGLAAAHATGLVHRDIKPANVLLEGADCPQVKLTDFGLARSADDASLTQSGMVVGTPMYMAPEQARGEAFDHRADLYSLGSVLYVMVTGRPPYRAASPLAVMKRVSEERPRPIQEIIPETPQWVCDIIAKLHASKPEDRFNSASEVACVLEKCLAGLHVGGPVVLPASATPTTPRLNREKWLKVAVAGLIAVAATSTILAFRPISRVDSTPQTSVISHATKAEPRVLVDFTNSLGIEFVRVPAGTSTLGGGGGVVGTRKVEIPYDFDIGKYEVTREEWEKVMGPGTAHSLFTRIGPMKELVASVSDTDLRRFPVDGVSWNDCQEFITRLNTAVKEKGWEYRLPTGKEWEYACRNGSGQLPEEFGCDFYVGTPTTIFSANRANCGETGLKRPCRVGSFAPNRLGIHDMHGNVFEWLDDIEMETKTGRLLAGGLWDDPADIARAKFRGGTSAGTRLRGGGLRMVRVPVDVARTPRQQFETVMAELKRLNPEFNGQAKPTIINDQITELRLPDDASLKDISPLHQLHHLQYLRASFSLFSDLTPLKGLPLRELWLNNNVKISDLSPLKGMPLESLGIWGFQGDDLSPLQGMPLRSLNCGGSGGKLDLSPLRGLPLNSLCVNCRGIEDLTPLAGMPLEELLIEYTHAEDLSPLQGMKLKKLSVKGVQIRDLSVIAGMPLQDMYIDALSDEDAKLVRSISTLKIINNKPAADYWKETQK